MNKYEGVDVDCADVRVAKQNAYFRMCARLAARSALQHKHGSIVVDRRTGRVIASGYNRATHHAECDAIRRMRNKRSSSPVVDLYVVRLRTWKRDRSDAWMGYSRPCARCESLIRSVARIRNVYYSLDLRYD